MAENDEGAALQSGAIQPAPKTPSKFVQRGMSAWSERIAQTVTNVLLVPESGPTAVTIPPGREPQSRRR